MAIEIDSLKWSQSENTDPATAFHVRVIPLMSASLLEIAAYGGQGLTEPRLLARGMAPYPITGMPYWYQSVWNIGDELMQLAQAIQLQE